MCRVPDSGGRNDPWAYTCLDGRREGSDAFEEFGDDVVPILIVFEFVDQKLLESGVFGEFDQC